MKRLAAALQPAMMDNGYVARIAFLALILITGVTPGCAQPEFEVTQREAGGLDLSEWIPARHGMVSLNGNWAFYPQEFVPAEELREGQRKSEYFLEVPGTWNQLVLTEPGSDGQPIGGSFFGTYHLRVKMPKFQGIFALRVPSALSAYEMWVDGQLVAAVGKPGNQESTTTAFYAPKSALFYSNGQTISLVIHISNFHHRNGGLYRPILLATDQQLISHERLMSMTDMFVLASIAVMAGYHLIHFCYRRQEVTSLYFALGCISVMVWHASNNEHLLLDLFPALSGKAGLRVEYCSFFASVSFFALFIQAMFPAHYPRLMVGIVVTVSIAFAVAVLPRSMLAASRLIPGFQAFTALAALVTILLLARALWRKAPLAGYILVGVVVFLATFLHDLLYSHGWIQTMWLSPFGLVFFVVTTSMTISVRFKRSFNHINQLKSTFEKFVPKRFLMRITDEDLSDIQLGNAHGESIVVLFSDIRGFTAISEQLSPADLLQYLNLYFQEMATVVKRNGGFIDKFIGDAVMALFDEDETDDQSCASSRALRAAIEMQHALPDLNTRLQQHGWPPIRIGIGIHFGPVVMGTVGAEFRMDSTVLGDTVNTAARLEGLAKQHQVPIVVSHALLAQLPGEHEFETREIGTVPIRGKQQPMQIFELLG